MVAVAPRSTWIHCGSAAALDQRVPSLPSTAAEAGVPAFSVDEALAALPCDSSETSACAGDAAVNSAASSASTATAAAHVVLRRWAARCAAHELAYMAAPSRVGG